MSVGLDDGDQTHRSLGGLENEARRDKQRLKETDSELYLRRLRDRLRRVGAVQTLQIGLIYITRAMKAAHLLHQCSTELRHRLWHSKSVIQVKSRVDSITEVYGAPRLSALHRCGADRLSAGESLSAVELAGS